MKFDRNLMEELVRWAGRPDRKPLILRGARQVGKTSLLKRLGKEHFKNCLYINFEKDESVHKFFEGDLYPEVILRDLSLQFGIKITPHKTLVIFDEIQECPRALTSLKYFNENTPEYAISSAGSLLGITLGLERSFPVGQVQFLDLYPLSFEEFLKTADERLYNMYQHGITETGLNKIVFHATLLKAFKRFFYCGGMPEAAKVIAAGDDFDEAREVLDGIEAAYQLDFAKHAPSAVEISKIQYVWNSLPSQLSKENKKFLYKTIRTGARAREYEVALLWLEQAGIIHKVYRTEKPGYPLSAYDDLSAFKIYTLDMGLLGAKAKSNYLMIQDGVKIFTEFKGALSENYVCQSLFKNLDVRPRYWTSNGIAEVDFIIQHKSDVIPIEVKSDENYRSKSLISYNKKYAPKIRIRISTKNLSFDGGLLNVPIFYVDQLKHFIDLALSQQEPK